MKRNILSSALGVFAAWALFARLATSPLPFEVASIKPSAPDARGTMMMFQPGGGLRATNTTLRRRVTVAYDVHDFQVTGSPGWMSSERYDIVARAERAADAPAGPDDLQKMTDEQLARPVLDKTELKGNYNHKLTWPPGFGSRGRGESFGELTGGHGA